MKDNKNNFVCIGAVHNDYILQLKSKHYKYRTNPIKQTRSLGGVAYNIAEKLSFLNMKIELISLNCEKEIINRIKKNKIKFKPLNKNIYYRSYTTVLNSKGQMILGMADMNNYEKYYNFNKFLNFKKKIIIFDLNFSMKNINSLILKYFLFNTICVSGTSGHKIYKIKNLLKNIDILILNKQESLNLANKKDILSSLKFLINKNKNLTIVITNGKNTVNAYNKGIIYKCRPPKTKIKNENKAGDVMSAFFYFYYLQSLSFSDILSKSIVAGSLHVSGYNLNRNISFKKIKKVSKNIKVSIKNYE